MNSKLKGCLLVLLGLVLGVACTNLWHSFVESWENWFEPIKEYRAVEWTKYGDDFEIEYMEMNFPDSCSNTTLRNINTGDELHFSDDPAVADYDLYENFSDGEYNIYSFHENYIVVGFDMMVAIPKESLREDFAGDVETYIDDYKSLIEQAKEINK